VTVGAGSGPTGPVPRWTAVPASDGCYALGEGPLWDAARGRVLWVDVNAGVVSEGRLQGSRVVETRTWAVDRTVGAVVAGDDGTLLVAGERSLFMLDDGGAITRGPVVLAPGTAHRLNDGACDPAGRFVVGSLSFDGRAGGEVLVRLESDGSLAVLDDDLTLSNGLAWSRDGSLLYSVDSVPGIVWVRSYDGATGAAGPRRAWLRVEDGIPDGLCIDAEDHLWLAVWGAGQVRRHAPDGTLVGVVDVPTALTSSVAFVGDDLGRLLITSAVPDGHIEAADPYAGRLFLADPGIAGHPTTRWAGLVRPA
jgi:sugar lactone lactonase YvrE